MGCVQCILHHKLCAINKWVRYFHTAFTLHTFSYKFKSMLLVQQKWTLPPSGKMSAETELVLESYFTDVTFDPCQATMRLGHVLGQARWYPSASKPWVSGVHERGWGEGERNSNKFVPGLASWHAFFRWALLKKEKRRSGWCMKNDTQSGTNVVFSSSFFNFLGF